MTIITTGLNIQTIGVNNAVNSLKSFGAQILNIDRQLESFTNNYERSKRNILSSSYALQQGLDKNWRKMYSGFRGASWQLERLENDFDRTFRQIGNKFQSLVMSSVALSMSGVSLQNWGQGLLNQTKTALNYARDFEVLMKQIEFYGEGIKDLEKVQKDIFAIDMRIPANASEIAEAVLGAQKTGYAYEEAIKLAEQASVIQFLSLGKMDGEESLKYISQLQKMTGYTADEVDKLTDKLAKTADVSSASIDSLWKTIQSSRSAFDNLNTDMDSMLAIAGVMSDRLQPRAAGQALSSFGRGINMAEKALMEGRGTRANYYGELVNAMGGNFDSFGGDVLAYIEAVATKSREIWGTGAERTSKLISIFGNSAIDLFHAYDTYARVANRTMEEMREEIKNADGHAQKLMDTFMNSSYGTEKRLESVVEQFRILYGQTIRPMFNTILDGITNVISGINAFLQQHPKLAKVLGYGVGFAGLFLVATGAVMTFTGALTAIYASLGSVITQIVRNTSVLRLLGMGYSTAGEMIRGQFLKPLSSVSKMLLRFTGVTFFLSMAWKNDFLRMRTTLTEWFNYVNSGFKKGIELFKIYATSSSEEWSKVFKQNQQNGVLDNWVANTVLRLGVLADAIKDIWNDGTISVEKYNKLSEMGLLGFIEQVYETKTAISDLWNGFIEGVSQGIELAKDTLGPLLNIFKWIGEKVTDILQHFGYFENEGKGISSRWEQIGFAIGDLVGKFIAIRLTIWGWVKGIKLLLAPFRKFWDIGRKLFNLFNNRKGGFFGGGGGGRLTKILSAFGLGGLGKKIQGKTQYGAHQPIPGATRTPTGQVTYDPVPKSGKARRQYYKKAKRQPVYYDSSDFSSGKPASRTVAGKGIRGKLQDLWYGRAYVPDVRTDKMGRTQHSVRTKDGRYMFTDASGKVKGQHVRTGGLRGAIINNPLVRRISKTAKAYNMVNFEDAGMDYAQSVGQKGHKRRSVKALFKGSINRRSRSGIVGGGNVVSRMQNLQGKPAMGLGGMLKNTGGAIAKAGAGIGKGLLKTLGGVITRGIPFIFKSAFRLIPILGWATMAWDLVTMVFSNWESIKNAGRIAWEWIKTTAVSLFQSGWETIKQLGSTAWNWITTDGIGYLGQFFSWLWGSIPAVWGWMKEKAGEAWTWVSEKAGEIWQGITGTIKEKISDAWTTIKNTAVETWTNLVEGAKEKLGNVFQPIKDAWNSAKDFIKNNPITQTVSSAIKTVSESKWNPFNWFGHRTGLWKVPRDNYPALLHQGEMVLDRKEAQILRSLVGSEKNSIAQYLLEREDGDQQVSIKTPPTRNLEIRPLPQSYNTQQAEGTSGGNSNVSFQFSEGAIRIQVSNAGNPQEVKRMAKQMFDEFKRLVELDNIKHYQPTKPRPRYN